MIQHVWACVAKDSYQILVYYKMISTNVRICPSGLLKVSTSVGKGHASRSHGSPLPWSLDERRGYNQIAKHSRSLRMR